MASANIDIKATTNEYRPCMVKYNGEEKKGLFHRWIEKENLLIKFDSYLTGKHMLDIKQHCDNEHIIPGDCNAIVIRNTLALVEFEDGTIGEVEPTNVRFLDS